MDAFKEYLWHHCVILPDSTLKYSLSVKPWRALTGHRKSVKVKEARNVKSPPNKRKTQVWCLFSVVLCSVHLFPYTHSNNIEILHTHICESFSNGVHMELHWTSIKHAEFLFYFEGISHFYFLSFISVTNHKYTMILFTYYLFRNRI